MNLKVYQSKNPKYAGHTAGPWKPHDTGLRRSGLPEHQIHWSEYGECVAEVVHGAENAALIADAPYLACEVERLRELCGELVGALEEIVNNAVKNYEGSMDIYPEAISVARSALAKAKGGDE